MIFRLFSPELPAEQAATLGREVEIQTETLPAPRRKPAGSVLIWAMFP